MIYYFSGTGNSKWAAERLAEILGDQAKDIMKERITQAQQEQVIGLVFPIYAWGVCEPMLSFVKQGIKTDAFVFALGTCGEDCGKSMKQLLKAYPDIKKIYQEFLIEPNSEIAHHYLHTEYEVNEKYTK